MYSVSSQARSRESGGCDDGVVTEEEWRRWGAVSPLPAAVKQIVNDLKVLEVKVDAQIEFGGNGGKLQVELADDDDETLSLWFISNRFVF